MTTAASCALRLTSANQCRAAEACAPAAGWGPAVAPAVASAVRGRSVAASIAAAAATEASATCRAAVRVLDPQARAAKLVAVARDHSVRGRPVQHRRKLQHTMLTAVTHKPHVQHTQRYYEQ